MKNDISIVVVDDNEIDLMIGKRMISRVDSNIMVKAFSSYGEVISWVRADKAYFASNEIIFFIDIYMSDGNGFKLTQEVFDHISTYNKKNVTFYLLSATIDDLDLKKVKKSDLIKGFIGKPLTVDIINNVINELHQDHPFSTSTSSSSSS